MIKVEVKKIDNTKREIDIEVSGERVKEKFTSAFKKIGDTVKVPGFRPGHVPQDILEKNFSGHAHELVLKELVPDAYDEAVKNQNLDVIDLPEISEVKLERTLLKFKAKVEVMPEIALTKYKGIKIDYKKIEVSADEIKRHLDAIKESRKLDNLDDSFAKSIGYPNLTELDKAIERQIFLQKENQQRQKIESDVVDTLVKEVDFKAPPALVKRQLQDLIRQTKMDLAIKGMPREKIESQEAQISKELESQAERQVRVYLVLAAIAKKENIPQDEHLTQHVMEFLLKEAEWQQAA